MLDLQQLTVAILKSGIIQKSNFTPHMNFNTLNYNKLTVLKYEIILSSNVIFLMQYLSIQL